MGEEQYVNHLSENIATLTFIPNEPSLLVIAFTDLSMSKFKDVNIVFDYAKIVGNATTLCWIDNGVMVGTKEGVIGYYETKKSKWKAKSTHSVLKIIKFNETSVLVGRHNSSIELRDWSNGTTICKVEKEHKLGEKLINMFLMDFRKEGYNQLVCIGEGGVIKAYNISKVDEVAKKPVAHEIKEISLDIEGLAR